MTTLNSESTEFGRFGFPFDSSFETFVKDSDVFLFGQKFLRKLLIKNFLQKWIENNGISIMDPN